MPRAYADVVGNFRQGQADAYVRGGRYDEASRVVRDPEAAQSYATMGNQQRARQQQDETRAYGREMAGALNSRDYPAAGAAAARYGDPEGVTAAQSGQRQATEQERQTIIRGALQSYAELQAMDQNNGQGYAEWRQRGQQAMQQHPDMPQELRRLVESLPEQWSPRVTAAVRTQIQGMLMGGMTEAQIAEQLRGGDWQGGSGFSNAYRIGPNGAVETGGALPLRPRAPSAANAGPPEPPAGYTIVQ